MAKQKTAQEYLIKAKLYRIVSLLFVTIGIFVFCILYVQNVDGRLVEALQRSDDDLDLPNTFVPAAALTMLADRAERKYKEMTSKEKSKK